MSGLKRLQIISFVSFIKKIMSGLKRLQMTLTIIIIIIITVCNSSN